MRCHRRGWISCHGSPQWTTAALRPSVVPADRAIPPPRSAWPSRRLSRRQPPPRQGRLSEARPACANIRHHREQRSRTSQGTETKGMRTVRRQCAGERDHPRRIERRYSLSGICGEHFFFRTITIARSIQVRQETMSPLIRNARNIPKPPPPRKRGKGRAICARCAGPATPARGCGTGRDGRVRTLSSPSAPARRHGGSRTLPRSSPALDARDTGSRMRRSRCTPQRQPPALP